MKPACEMRVQCLAGRLVIVIMAVTCVIFFLLLFFFFIFLEISMSVLLVSENSFMSKDVKHLSRGANEIPYFIAIGLLWGFVSWL